jgi:hypothetical protein
MKEGNRSSGRRHEDPERLRVDCPAVIWDANCVLNVFMSGQADQAVTISD